MFLISGNPVIALLFLQVVQQSSVRSETRRIPNILMKKQKYVVNSDNLFDPIKLDPPECIHTRFTAPFQGDIHFPTKAHLAEMASRSECTWNFMGSEVCTPMLNCPVFSLPTDCAQANLTVRDGYVGEQTFCGTDAPLEIIASNALRDLYITLHYHNSHEVHLNCTISCTHRGKGIPLHQDFDPHVEKKCRCGNRPNANRIVNGFAGKKSEFPWLVAVVEAKTRQPFCGGSVINDRFILTAAHCFKGKYMDYRRVQMLLESEVLDVTPNTAVTQSAASAKTYPPGVLEELDRGNGTVRFNIEEIIVHPLYVSETNDYDVALIKTAERINITSLNQNPVCLPPLGSYPLTYAHKMAIVAGWGLGGVDAAGTETQLQKLNVTVFSQRLCKELYVHRVNKRMMCAGYKEGGRDSCMGDSGGPLIVETAPKVWTQIGTVSWGEGCALADNPGVYYRTTETGQWIHHVSNMRDAVWCAEPPKSMG